MTRPLRLLVVILPEPGHLNPFVAVVQELVRDGHTVDVFCFQAVAAHFAAECPSVRCFCLPSRPSLAKRPMRSRALAELLVDEQRAPRWYEFLFLSNLRPQIEALDRVVTETRPEA